MIGLPEPWKLEQGVSLLVEVNDEVSFYSQNLTSVIPVLGMSCNLKV